MIPLVFYLETLSHEMSQIWVRTFPQFGIFDHFLHIFFSVHLNILVEVRDSSDYVLSESSDPEGSTDLCYYYKPQYMFMKETIGCFKFVTFLYVTFTISCIFSLRIDLKNLLRENTLFSRNGGNCVRFRGRWCSYQVGNRGRRWGKEAILSLRCAIRINYRHICDGDFDKEQANFF